MPLTDTMPTASTPNSSDRRTNQRRRRADRAARSRLAAAYGLSAGGYALGLVTSALTDWPSGPAIVWVMSILAVFVFVAGPRAASVR